MRFGTHVPNEIRTIGRTKMSSRNKPHEIISGAGWLVQFAGGVITGLREHGVGDEAIHRLGTPAGTETMKAGISAFVEAIAPIKDTDFLRYLKAVTIAPTKGDVTLAKADDVFMGWIDGYFKNWGTNVLGEDTDETAVDVYEMARDGNYQKLFGSLGDPHRLCLTQGQIKEFCRSHRDVLLQEGYATFFLFAVNGEPFVAYVDVHASKLRVFVNHFDDDYVWDTGCRPRLVVKQQTV